MNSSFFHFCAVFSLFLTHTRSTEATLIAPRNQAWLPTNEAVLVEWQTSCPRAQVSVHWMNGSQQEPSLVQEDSYAYGRRILWIHPPHAPSTDKSWLLKVSEHCSRKIVHQWSQVTFSGRSMQIASEAMARTFMNTHSAFRLKWDWSEAVALFGLSRILQGERLRPGTYSQDLVVSIREYLVNYYSRWIHKGIPTINRSDRCAPALAVPELLHHTNSDFPIQAARRVSDYLIQAPRNRLGTLDHLGNHNILSTLYPSSIWVDSLMMFGVFAHEFGNQAHIPDLVSFAREQPAIFSSVLREKTHGLFRHAYFLGQFRTEPIAADFWLRGNGWVAYSLAEINEQQPHAEALSIARSLLSATHKFRMPNHLWDTVLNAPGFSYPEVSGSALLAAAFAKTGQLEQAHDIYRGVIGRLSWSIDHSGRPLASVPEVSGPTNPTDRDGYSLMPIGDNYGYGFGSALLLTTALSLQSTASPE